MIPRLAMVQNSEFWTYNINSPQNFKKIGNFYGFQMQNSQKSEILQEI